MQAEAGEASATASASASATQTRSSHAIGLALDFVRGVGWLVVVAGTALAWLGLDFFGGLSLSTLGGEQPFPWFALLATAGVAMALTFLMSVIWRGEGRDTWMLLLGASLVVLLLAGSAAMVGVATSETGSFHEASRVLTVIGAASPLVCTLLGLLVATGALFPRFGRVAAGLLTCGVEVCLFLGWAAAIFLVS